jgi:polyketide-type polyunsaturated fatty acid synthase PfaA
MKPVETNNCKELLPIPIAIVGIGSIFPEAQTVGEFWENILSRKSSIKEIVDREPEYYDGYWRIDEYFDSDPATSDRTYGKTGAFFPEVEFDPIEFGIPPVNLESISTVQIMALLVAKQALADAGYTRDESTALLRDKTGVILGVGGSGNIAFTLAARTDAPRWEKVIKNFGFPDEMVTSIVEKLKSLYAGWRESSFPGLLANVVSGRITSHFDLGGTNCTIDAACASSLAAIKMAIAELTDGSCDAVLTGGVNVDNSIVAYMCFSKTPALSREGLSRPFDADSDGIVLGDGVGMVVLKRLEDAERDGSKIYGVIRSIGTSSDGRAKSIYAPRFEGQVKALNRAYQRAGLTPKDIQLVEAHGTGTVAGDMCEFKSIASVYEEHQVAKESVALGSVKSQIGHTRTAAGAASLIKATLALYNKILPPTINVTQPNPQFELENSSFYLNTETRPWIQPADGSKRRAAISSFGFGGTNFHMVLEEYQQEHETPYRTHSVPDIVIFQASDRNTLIATCEELLEKFKSSAGKNCYHQYLNDSRHKKIPINSARIGFVSESLEQTIEYLKESLLMLASHSKDYWQHPKGIYYRAVGMDLRGKVVALFPGQGSQYVNMAAELANNYPQMRQVLSDMNKILYEQNQPIVSDIIYPPITFNQDKKIKQEQELLKTENAQPAIGAISAGIYKILQKAGFKPDFIIGHSFGEITALWASSVLSDEDFYHLAIARGRAMSFENNSGLDRGLMLAVNANEQNIKVIIGDVADIKITNYNSNSQVVLGGSKKSIEALHKVFQGKGIKSTILNVSNAFHTDFVSHASKPFAQSIALTDFELPDIPVYSNVTARPYPHNTDKIKKILAGHLVSSVAFRQGIELIYNQGGSVFIEIGPKKVLTNFVSDILRDKEHIAVALNPGLTANSEYEFRRSIVQLLVAGLTLEDIDPYQMPKPIEQPKSRRGLPITLNGGVYLNPQTQELRQSSLLQRDTTLLDAFIKQQTHSQ